MGFWITMARLARTPRVLVPTLLLAAALATAALLAVPTTYTSSTTMVLTTTEFGGSESRNPDNPTDLVNPMLTFNDSLRTSADMLIWSMNSKEVAGAFEEDGAVTLTVNDGRTNPDFLSFNGPIVYVSAASADPEEAERAVEVASQMMRAKLLEWQEAIQAPSRTYVSLLDVVPPGAAEADDARRTKLSFIAALAGLAAGLAIAYAWTRARATRTSRRVRHQLHASATAPKASAGPPSTTSAETSDTPAETPARTQAGTPARAPVKASKTGKSAKSAKGRPKTPVGSGSR